MLVTRVDQLPTFGATDTVIVDCETTSWDDEVKALNPFQGHRVAGYAVASEDGRDTWYVPIRHHGSDDCVNLPIEPVKRWIQALLGCPTRIWSNHEIKFDGRFAHFDGVVVRATMQDTKVLARLVDHFRDKDTGGTGYGLDALAADYLGLRKTDVHLAYLRGIKSKDFGRLPLRLVGPYGENDARVTALLRLKLLSKLPAISQRVWEIEQRLTHWLLLSEIRGIGIDRAFMKETHAKVFREFIEVMEKIEAIAGREVTLSNPDITKLLVDQLGIQPKSFGEPTKKMIEEGRLQGNPTWNVVALKSLEHPIGPLIAQANHLQHFISTFLEGWFNRVGEDGKLHPNLNQDGTATGRMSSSGPNFQQVPVEAEPFVVADPGTVMVYFDYSQMEYRLFGHYTNDPTILAAYRTNIDTDFHSYLASVLGVDRQFAKQLNFSFLYGMGKASLMRNLAAVLSVAAADGDPTTNQKLRDLLFGGGTQTAARAEALDVAEQQAAAEKIYQEYHARFPSIRQFQSRVKNTLRLRGWLKNYYGRVYTLDSAHKGPNYLIQGSCADLFKDKINRICDTMFESHGALPITLVHDSCLWQIQREAVADFFNKCREELETTDLRVPMYCKGGVSIRSWGQMITVPHHCTPADIEVALEKSAATVQRAWGT
jgi:DNA polymerase I-like protein with 3'-5' exonuclease and polymerase domains